MIELQAEPQGTLHTTFVLGSNLSLIIKRTQLTYLISLIYASNLFCKFLFRYYQNKMSIIRKIVSFKIVSSSCGTLQSLVVIIIENLFARGIQTFIMKLLTHNMLTSCIIKGVTKGYPLGIQVFIAFGICQFAVVVILLIWIGKKKTNFEDLQQKRN